MIGRHRAVTEEESAKILRLHHAEHWPVGTIAAELGRHHDTIERVLAQSGLPVTKPSPRPRLVDAYVPFIAATLAKHPRLRASRLWAMVRERGYAGSRSGFRAVIRRLRPRRPTEAFLRRSVLAGQEAQVDWAHFGKLAVGRALRDLWAIRNGTFLQPIPLLAILAPRRNAEFLARPCRVFPLLRRRAACRPLRQSEERRARA